MIIHLVNYDAQNHSLIKNISIRLKLPDGKQVKEITLFSPDIEVNGGTLSYQANDEYLSFSVPGLHVYDLVTVQLD